MMIQILPEKVDVNQIPGGKMFVARDSETGITVSVPMPDDIAILIGDALAGRVEQKPQVEVVPAAALASLKGAKA
jgi:hypothetical protein